MHPSQHAAAGQQQRIRRHVAEADAYGLSNLLTGPQLLDYVEPLLPEKEVDRYFLRVA